MILLILEIVDIAMPGSLWTLLVCSVLSVDFFYYFIGRWTIDMYGHDFFHPSFLAAWAFIQTCQAYETLYGFPKVQTEFSIIALCYNMRRSMSILTPKGLKMALNQASLSVLSLCRSTRHHSMIFFTDQRHNSQRFSLSYH